LPSLLLAVVAVAVLIAWSNRTLIFNFLVNAGMTANAECPERLVEGVQFTPQHEGRSK
jgi:hypothetical protein